MKSFINLITLLIVTQSFGQSTVNLSHNNVNAILNDDGLFFNNSNYWGYEVPSGSGKHSIYSSSFWFASSHEGVLKISSQLNEGTAFGPGPLTIGTAMPSTLPPSQSIWKLTKIEIENHIENFQSPGYSLSPMIASWPAHGDVSAGFSYNLAPYVDVDGNDMYEPLNGDYPCIKGDECVYIILNDKSGSIPNQYALGLELHYMFYQFSSTGYLDNTTFIDLSVYNRTVETYNDFLVSYFIDGDLGNPYDDYVGCDSTRRLAFIYNGDNFDQDTLNTSGYGVKIPALGVYSLKQEMKSFITYPLYQPTNAMIYYLMQGKQVTAASQTTINGSPTDYFFSGNPLSLEGENEIENGHIPGDRNLIVSSSHNSLGPNNKLELSYALIVSEEYDDSDANVNKLIHLTDSIQAFYDNSLDNLCNQEAVQIEQVNLTGICISPNPFCSSLNLNFNNLQQKIKIVITDLSGRQVHNETYYNLSEMDILIDGTPGSYLISIENDQSSFVQRLIKL